MVHKVEVAANLGLADTLGSLGDTPPLHALLFRFKVPHKPATRKHKQHAGLP
jgi:hypothetical protein